jgi:Phage gp6-like head-tail connector protein
MLLRLVTPPAVEPISLAEAKLHCKVDIPDDDDLIAGLITAVRQRCEAELARSFVSTAWRLELDLFPNSLLDYRTWPSAGSRQLERSLISGGVMAPILPPRADLIAVQSIRYVDSSGALQTLDPSAYKVQSGAPGRIVPAYGRTWPSARFEPAAVLVDFTAGYGTAADVPACLKVAIKLWVGMLYNNREAAAEVALAEIPLGLKVFLATEDWGCYA